jgi:hypothetical protein
MNYPSEVVDVPEDSPEAKKWPRWNPPEKEDSSEPLQSSSTSTSTPKPPPAKRPGPRKPKTSLTALPSSKKPTKKLSTLDKSVMDWRVHINSQRDSTIKDELEANRRGGGYLEKVEFLKRVEERKDDVFENNKARKRRKL